MGTVLTKKDLEKAKDYFSGNDYGEFTCDKCGTKVGIGYVWEQKFLCGHCFWEPVERG
jgi:hypothetical protein